MLIEPLFAVIVQDEITVFHSIEGVTLSAFYTLSSILSIAKKAAEPQV
ncbi:hypothetical protein IQ268_10870 [Oculatella sp. LEGE 06141]|nr:hypothetical protein [Oculatella sp. LEGE 06141]MBE9179063.1 hypothetical protein [Oculatella sp. LEGE 06141]